jgi:hypothetical protein
MNSARSIHGAAHRYGRKRKITQIILRNCAIKIFDKAMIYESNFCN